LDGSGRGLFEILSQHCLYCSARYGGEERLWNVSYLFLTFHIVKVDPLNGVSYNVDVYKNVSGTLCILTPTEVNENINMVRIAGPRFEIRTLNLPNTNPTLDFCSPLSRRRRRPPSQLCMSARGGRRFTSALDTFLSPNLFLRVLC
jgi:hypothetical protein